MNKLVKQLEIGKLYTGLPVYRKRLRFAMTGIKKMLSLAPRSYVSVSFGKQSICLAHMVYSVCPEMPMYFLASGESWHIHNFSEVIGNFLSHTPINLEIIQTNHGAIDIARYVEELSGRHPNIKWQHRGNPDVTLSWKETRDAGQHDLREMCSRDEWDGWYWGLSKEESYGRRMTLSYRWGREQPHSSIFRYEDGKFRCCPLMNWTIYDIAGYISTHGIQLLNEYEAYGLEARTTARATKMMAEEGGIALLKKRNLNGFNVLCARFPELRAMT